MAFGTACSRQNCNQGNARSARGASQHANKLNRGVVSISAHHQSLTLVSDSTRTRATKVNHIQSQVVNPPEAYHWGEESDFPVPLLCVAWYLGVDRMYTPRRRIAMCINVYWMPGLGLPHICRWQDRVV